MQPSQDCNHNVVYLISICETYWCHCIKNKIEPLIRVNGRNKSFTKWISSLFCFDILSNIYFTRDSPNLRFLKDIILAKHCYFDTFWNISFLTGEDIPESAMKKSISQDSVASSSAIKTFRSDLHFFARCFKKAQRQVLTHTSFLFSHQKKKLDDSNKWFRK